MLSSKIIGNILKNTQKNKCVCIHGIIRFNHNENIKQHLSNIWSTIHEKVKQHWGWVEKKSCLPKKRVFKDKALKMIMTIKGKTTQQWEIEKSSRSKAK